MTMGKLSELFETALKSRSQKARRPALDEMATEIGNLKRQLDWERGKNATLQRELKAALAKTPELHVQRLQDEVACAQSNYTNLCKLVYCKCGKPHVIVDHSGPCLD